MTELTPFDVAHAAMQAAPEDDSARLRFYERLADTEMFMLLQEESDGDEITPEVFELSDESFVLLFDREERLADFAGQAVPYVALSGRVIVQTLFNENIGLAINPEVAPSSILIPPQAVDWLHETLGNTAEQVEVKVEKFSAPKGLPENVLLSLDTKLATAAGLARAAYLVGVTYDTGAQGHLLGFIDALPQAQSALVNAVGEALTFSGIDAGALDVGFFAASDPTAQSLAKAGLRFDLPEPESPVQPTRGAPGSDPEKPPIIR